MPVPDEFLQRMLDLAREVSRHLRGFYLAGGTALMLRHRHRMSTDLDFFRGKPFSFRHLERKLRQILPVEHARQEADSLDLWIAGVRVSFVFFPFRNIRKTERFQGVPVASDYDIYLNKIYAAGRRVEPKDAVDFVFLTERYRWPWDQVKRDFERKFPDQPFEIYLGAVLNERDYPGLSEEVRAALRRIAREVKAWRMDSG